MINTGGKMISKACNFKNLILLWMILGFGSSGISEPATLDKISGEIQKLAEELKSFKEDTIKGLSSIEEKLSGIENSKKLESEAQNSFRQISPINSKIRI